MQKALIHHGAGDSPRGFETYEPIPAVSGLAPGDLDMYLEAIQIQPISAIEWTWKGGWKVGPRTWHDSMWFWFAEGKGAGWVDDPAHSFRLQAGDLVLIPQGTAHSLRSDHDSSMRLYSVHFHAQVFGALNILRLLGIPLHIRYEEVFGQASERLCHEFAVKQDGWQMSMRWTLQSLILHLVRSYATRCNAVYSSGSQKELPRLLPVFEMIDKHIGDRALSVTSLAEAVFLSEVQFRKIFKDATGLSPAKFIQRRRVERSCVQLRTTQHSIEQIAFECGFLDTPYFYRVFRSWMGTSPYAYRLAIRSSVP